MCIRDRIHSDTVAKAMIKIANNDFQQNIFESNEIEELNNSWNLKLYYLWFNIFSAGSVFFIHDSGIESTPFKAAK